jgi:hypothetical protein
MAFVSRVYWGSLQGKDRALLNADYAAQGLAKLGLSGASVVNPSETCINVVQTSDGALIFAYDSGSKTSGLAVMPSLGEVESRRHG